MLFENKNKLIEFEKNILGLISGAEGDELIKDETLIDALGSSKKETIVIADKIQKLNED